MAKKIRIFPNNKVGPSPKPAANQKSTPNKEELKSKSNVKLELFCERVAISGLEESYKADFVPTKLMFRLALLLAFAFIVYEAFTISVEARKESVIFFDSDLTGAPFPNVSVCLPISINESTLARILVIPKKEAALMDKYRFTKEDIIGYLKDVFSLNSKPNAISSPIGRILASISEATVQALEEKFNIYDGNFLKFLSPRCEDTLSNCIFDGKPFDCCRAAVYYPLMKQVCFHMDLKKIVPLQNDPPISNEPNSLKTEALGLSFDISTNWTNGIFDDGAASDGYYLFFDTLPEVTGDPAHVPSDTNAVVVLAEPQNINEIRKCRPMNNIPRIDYLNYYDSKGLTCRAKIFVDVIAKFLGCNVPVMTYFPKERCTFQQLFLLFLAYSTKDQDYAGTNMAQQENQAYDLLVKQEMECQPLCSRWTYRVLSTSYGSIRYRDRVEQNRQHQNRSWSRINILLPSSLSTSRTEQWAVTTYLVMCKIGAVMGVYAGFSAVTFAQVIFYGLHGLRGKESKKRDSTMHFMRPK